MTLVKVGVYCLRGGGHWACYDEEDAMACGTKGPAVFIDVQDEDYAMYPEWLQRVMDTERCICRIAVPQHCPIHGRPKP